mgnify:CR=1 FL=1
MAEGQIVGRKCRADVRVPGSAGIDEIHAIAAGRDHIALMLDQALVIQVAMAVGQLHASVASSRVMRGKMGVGGAMRNPSIPCPGASPAR